MKKLIFICFLFSLQLFVYAQNTYSIHKNVEGTVVDTRGEPLIGVSIKEKNGKAISVTDIEGKFSMSLPLGPNATIVASYIGYQTEEVKLEGRTNVHIVLKEDAQSLDEMVVIGYGAQKKSSLTSSVETISAADLLKMATPNLDQALAGQVAGLNVMSSTGDPTGRQAQASIRGIVGEPLLVIDGVPRFGNTTSDTETRLSDLNPDDIESISVLKDAAATAVYGARAARGVILVTTKRGKADGKIRINYRGQYSVQKATKYPEFLDAYDFAQLYNRALDNSPDFQYNAKTGAGFKYFSDSDLDKIRTGSAPNEFGNNNLFDYLKNHGSSTSHTLTISGGNENISYYVSGGYTNTEGLYSGVGRDRFNYSMKLDALLTKDLKFSVDVLGSRSDNKNTSYATIDAAYDFSPTQVLRYTDGRLTSINGGNPLISVDGLGGYTKNTANINTVTAKLNYTLPWVKGLSAYLKGTFDYNTTRVKKFQSPVTLYMPDTANPGQFVEDPNTVYPKAQISLSEQEQTLNNTLVEGGFNYDNTFAGKHNVGGMLIASYQRTDSRYLSGLNNNLAGKYPEIIGSGITGTINGDEARTERASLIGRASYGYDFRYFLEANFRVDGSTKFHPDNRWKFFPSISGSWVASNEAFFKNWEQDVLSNLKFRASTGLLGDDGATDNYSYQMRYIFSQRQGYNFGGSVDKQGVIPSIDPLPNIDLEMEKRRDYNLGIDLGFWDNRFSVTYEYYWRYRTNMIEQVPSYLYPPSAGASGSTPYVNIGKVKEWGWDLTLTHRNSIGKVKYNVDFMLAKTDNKVLDWGDESSLAPYRQRKGKPYMTWTLFESDGLFQSWEEIESHPIDQDGNGNATLAPGDIKYKDQNGDNKITDLDKVYVRNSSYPDYSLSVKLGAEYKGFSFSAMFQGITGYKQMMNEIYSLYNNGLQRFMTYHRDDSWTEENPTARYPRVMFSSTNGNNRKASTFWIEDCDFVRLKSLTFGYNIPPRLLKSTKIATMNISFQATNLFTWSTLRGGIDPESLRGYPIQRTYGVSLNVGF